MKKIITLVLAVLMLATMSVTAFAAENTDKLTDEKTSTTIDVTAVYAAGASTPDVVSVDLEWGAMEFTYSVGGTHEWNPADHSYTDKTTASWSAEGNTVKATNHSNIKVNVSFAFESKVNNVTGNFGELTSPVELAAGVVGGYDTAANVTATLTLEGELPSDHTGSVGTITVSISK